MADFLEDYAAATDRNERYRLICRETARLRGEADENDFYDPEAVGQTIGRLNETVDGDLIAFVANDFGLPRAYRPEHADVGIQDAVRRAILDHKYDESNPELGELRAELLDAHPGVHKAIVAVVDGASVRYHLPEGSSPATNFLTVRQMLGLVDYTTNSFQGEGRSLTY